MMNRRRFFTGTAALSASAIGFPRVAQSAGKLLESRGQRPGRIILLVADGMSMGTLTCADYLSRQLRGRGLSWMELFRQPATRRALMNMSSLNSMVTDSAAASSSRGSGSRVENGTINQLPNGIKLRTLYELFAESGWKRGLVTTTEITHATPAGFAAVVDSTGYAAADRRAGWFQAFLAKKGNSVYELMNSEVVQLGQLLANHFGIGWTGNVHTSDYVPLIAMGPGAERFEGFIENIDVFRHYTELARIDFQNPRFTPKASGPEASAVERLEEYAFA